MQGGQEQPGDNCRRDLHKPGAPIRPPDSAYHPTRAARAKVRVSSSFELRASRSCTAATRPNASTSLTLSTRTVARTPDSPVNTSRLAFEPFLLQVFNRSCWGVSPSVLKRNVATGREEAVTRTLVPPRETDDRLPPLRSRAKTSAIAKYLPCAHWASSICATATNVRHSRTGGSSSAHPSQTRLGLLLLL